MTQSLETVKKLRELGASVQMQEDLAHYLGGHENPLFLPTIEFIINLQNAAKEQSIEEKLDLSKFDIPDVYDPTFFEKVSIEAAKETLKTANLTSDLKQKLINYLTNLEIQKASHDGELGQEGASRSPSKGRKKSVFKSGNEEKSLLRTIVDKLTKQHVYVAQNQRAQEEQKRANVNRIRQLLQKIFLVDRIKKTTSKKIDHSGEKQSFVSRILKGRKYKQESGQHSENRFNEKKGKKTKISSPKVEHDFHLPEVTEKAIEARNVGAVDEGHELEQERSKKAENEISISAEINEKVKAGKEGKKPNLHHDGKKEDGKEQQNLKEKQNVRIRTNQMIQVRQKMNQRRQQNERVSKMTIDDAVKGLNGGGVREATNKDQNLKKDLDKQTQDIAAKVHEKG